MFRKLQDSNYKLWFIIHNNFITQAWWLIKWFVKIGWRGEPICGWPQNYKVAVLYRMPEHWKTQKNPREFIVDSCITEEIEFLIAKGVRTIESCCGHVRWEKDSYICVDKESIPTMLSLGYKQQTVYGELRLDLFTPLWPITHVAKVKWKGVKKLC